MGTTLRKGGAVKSENYQEPQKCYFCSDAGCSRFSDKPSGARLTLSPRAHTYSRSEWLAFASLFSVRFLGRGPVVEVTRKHIAADAFSCKAPLALSPYLQTCDPPAQHQPREPQPHRRARLQSPPSPEPLPSAQSSCSARHLNVTRRVPRHTHPACVVAPTCVSPDPNSSCG